MSESLDSSGPGSDDLSSSEYEDLVTCLVQKLIPAFSAVSPATVNGSDGPRIKGQSGYAHQIDISIQAGNWKALIECKYWKRPVNVQAVLTHLARLHDIGPTLPGSILIGSIISTKYATAGAKLLSEFYGLQLNIVVNIEEFAMQIAEHILAGVNERAVASDVSAAAIGLPAEVNEKAVAIDSVGAAVGWAN